MPQTHTGPQTPPAPSPRPPRPNAGRDGLFAAILLAFFLHLLLYWATPATVFDRPPSVQPAPQFVELTLEPLPEQPDSDERYVRAAPDIPEAVPDPTRNISDRDQRAAQEQAAPPDPENTPYVEGDEPDSPRIVQGDPFSDPMRPTPPAASQASGSSPLVQQEAAPRETPAEAQPDLLEQIPETDEGIASLPDPAEAREPTEQPAEARRTVTVESPLDESGEARITTPPQADEAAAPTPRPRLRVERDTSYGPIRDNRQGTIQIGRLAFDAQHSEFGEYWRRVAEVIEARWRNLVYNTRAIPFGGNRVVVQFSITRKGQVENLTVAFSNAGKLAETVSVDAIVGEAPFFEWTPEMIVKMGDQVQAAIHFHY